MKEIKKYKKECFSSFLLGSCSILSNVFAKGETQAAVNQVNKLVNSLYKPIQAAGFFNHDLCSRNVYLRYAI